MNLYFAYGSNLLAERIQQRVPSATYHTVANLKEHSLRFHKRSKDGSGKADAFYTGEIEDSVHGVLWDILDSADLPKLDRVEGAGKGYNKAEVIVETPLGDLSAFTFFAEEQAIDPGLTPYDWYKELVIIGVREHGFPIEYLEEIESIPSMMDPDSDRATKNKLSS